MMKQFKQAHILGIHPHSLAISIIVLFALGGCATPASHESMIPTNFDIVKKHSATVNVATSGGRETESIGKSQISDEALAKALTEAITKSQTFSKVVQGNEANYLLTVSIFSVEQPSFGLSYLVKMEVGWTLKQADTSKIVWQEAIKSEHMATPGDAFAAVKRLRLATEGAAKNNIEQGLAKISKLAL